MKSVILKIRSNALTPGLILLLATLLRLWGIGFGLPLTNSKHDELYIIQVALHMGTGDFNPHVFNYPSFYFYILFALYGLYYLFGRIIGRFSMPIAFLNEFVISPTNFFLINRLLSAACDIATVWVVYKLATCLFNKRVALLAALLTSIAYVEVREAHFGKIDTAATLMTMLALWFISRLQSTTRLRNYILAGFVSGLAASTKYTGIFLSLPLLLTYVTHHHQQKNSQKQFFRKIFLTLLSSGLGFIIATPFAFFDFPTFYKDIVSLVQTAPLPWYGVNQGIGWAYHLKISFWAGLGPTMITAALIGILLLFKNNWRRAILLTSFPIAYYFFIGNSYIVFARYIVPVVPFLCICAAYFVNEVNRIVTRHSTFRVRQLVLWLLTIIICIPSLVNVLQFDNVLTQKDNRLIAAEWIYSHLRGGSSYTQVGTWLGVVQLLPSIAALNKQYLHFTPVTQEQQIKRGLILKKIGYLEKMHRNGYEEQAFDLNHLPDYIIAYETPLLIDQHTSPINPVITATLAKSYVLLQSFKAADFNKKNIYEHQDAFYVPFVSFTGVIRPGPNIFIYGKNTKDSNE